jgi:hypothetical protein
LGTLREHGLTRAVTFKRKCGEPFLPDFGVHWGFPSATESDANGEDADNLCGNNGHEANGLRRAGPYCGMLRRAMREARGKSMKYWWPWVGFAVLIGLMWFAFAE